MCSCLDIISFYSFKSLMPNIMNSKPTSPITQTNPPFRTANAAVPTSSLFVMAATNTNITRIRPVNISSHLFIVI